MTAGDRYPVPVGMVLIEAVIKRSRFVTRLGPAPTVEAARAFIDTARAEHSDATHNCWAYLVGPPGSTAQVGMSDDGEPHGTAGRPMLNVLLHCGAGDLVAVTTRYFGGIKLGTGGLVRAYSGGVRVALEAVELRDKISWCQLLVELEYPMIESFRRICLDFEAEVLDESFSDRVLVTLRLPEERSEELRSALADRFSGRAEVLEPGDSSSG